MNQWVCETLHGEKYGHRAFHHVMGCYDIYLEGMEGMEGMVESTQLKVLLVTFSDNADHQEVIYSLYEELPSYHDVWAMTIKDPKVPYLHNGHVVHINAPKRPGIQASTFNVPELYKVLRFIRKQKFDVIYFETLHTWNIPIWIFHPRNTVILQAMHEVEPHEGDGAVKSVELMNKATVKLADYILLRNKNFIEPLKRKYGYPSERIRSLDPWRRFPDYDPLTHSHRALFFGRINKYKGIEYLPEIIEKCPDVQFDIVGRVDDGLEDTVEQIRKLHNAHLCTEYVTDAQMVDYFHNADFVILPYKSASQSGVVLDSDKFARPPIAFNVGAIGDQIVEGVNGTLIKAGDVNAFSSKVSELANMDDAEMDAFSKRAFDYAFDRFSSKSAAKRFSDLIKEIAKK